MGDVVNLQYQLTQLVIQEEMDEMDVQIGEVDAHINDDDNDDENKDKKGNSIIDATIVNESSTTTTATATAATSTSTITVSDKKKTSKHDEKKKSKKNKKEIKRLVKEIEKQNTELLLLEMDFIRAVVEVMGPVSTFTTSCIFSIQYSDNIMHVEGCYYTCTVF